MRSNGPSAAPPAPRREDFATQDAALKRRHLDRERAAASERRALEEQCARVRQEHNLLASGIRIARVNEQGERVFMDDTVRDKRIAELAQELRACP
jgi:hypothetical protein